MRYMSIGSGQTIQWTRTKIAKLHSPVIVKSAFLSKRKHGVFPAAMSRDGRTPHGSQPRNAA